MSHKVDVNILGKKFSIRTSDSPEAVEAAAALVQQQIDELEKLKKMSEDATKPLEKELKGLEQKIKNAQAGIIAAQKQSEKLAADIDKREEDLAIQYVIFSNRIASQYKRSRTFSPFFMPNSFFNSFNS